MSVYDRAKLLVPIDEPECGPPLSEGEMVLMLRAEAGAVMIRSCEKHEDSGDGTDDPTEEYTYAWVTVDELEKVGHVK